MDRRLSPALPEFYEPSSVIGKKVMGILPGEGIGDEVFSAVSDVVAGKEFVHLRFGRGQRHPSGPCLDL